MWSLISCFLFEKLMYTVHLHTVKPHFWYLQFYSLFEVTSKICIRYSNIRYSSTRVKYGNFGHKVNWDSDLVCIIF